MKKQERKTRRESKITPEEAVKKKLKRQKSSTRFKKSEMTPMKTREKIVKIKDVFITSNMIIDELNDHDLVLEEIKKDKVRGINTMSRANLEKLFFKYMKVENVQKYFNDKQIIYYLQEPEDKIFHTLLILKKKKRDHLIRK